ncbi:MAG: Mur ligase family protein [Patescibacteria group bacterium]
MLKKLDNLLSEVGDYQVFGKRDLEIKGISEDSRRVKKEFLFVAIKGLTVDGHDYISRAIEKGAVAVVGEREKEEVPIKGVAYARVKDSREAVGKIASAFYGYPSTSLKVIGVTGTDGKTTTAHLIYHILNSAGKKTGLVSTVSAKIGEREYETGLHVTSPEPILLQKFLSEMVKEGCVYAVIEVTSHGIDQKRIEGTKFMAAALTNISHEHLDYHKTFEAYRDTKLKFLKMAEDFVVLNSLDPSFEYLKENLKDKEIVTYGLDKDVSGVLPGEYNELNASLALGLVEKLGIEKEIAIKALHSFKLPAGRLEKVESGKDFDVYIDFAHTPNALESVLSYLKSKTRGRLIAVFGCAGERDREKRPKMAEVATTLADSSFFTTEDPRSENVNDILKEMEKGAKNKSYTIIPERGEAILEAIKAGGTGDTIVICGKGHEKSMAFGNTEYPWSDREAIEEALKGKIKKIER